MLHALDPERYDVIPVGLTREGAYVLMGAEVLDYTFDVDHMPEVPDNGTRVAWPVDALGHELTATDAQGQVRSLGQIDVVFPILHGPFGEDGTIQGMLELVDLPYVGSGVLASAVGMDKHFTKTVLKAEGIAVAPWVVLSARDWATSPEKAHAALDELGLPVFVKPARAGSSVGVSRVASLADLDAAMTLALAEDDKVLIEAAVVGREIECAVLGGRAGAGARASSVAGEVVLTGRDFYDFDSKYLAAPGVELECPADLTGELLAELQELSVRAFNAIDGAGLARVDFFLGDDGFVLNEINTMPGFTPISMFPKCWQESGMSYPALIDELIALALDGR